MYGPEVAGGPMMALQNATGVPSMSSPTSMGVPHAQSMPALTAETTMNDPLRAGAGTGLMGSSPSQPHVQVPQYGTSSSSQFTLQPQRKSLPQMVLGALKSTFGVSQQAAYEPPDPGPYSRFNRPPPPGLVERFKKRRKEFPAWIRQYMDMPKRTRLSTRFEEVDFIRKSRMREHHRDDIVSIIGRSTPCELLDRPGQGKSKVRGKRALDGDVQQAPGLVGGPNTQLAGRPGVPGAPGAVGAAGAPGAPAAPGAQGQPR